MAMKHQNKSIFSSFTFSIAVLDGAHSYLKFHMVMGLDSKLPQEIAAPRKMVVWNSNFRGISAK